MDERITRVLLLEDTPSDADVVRRALEPYGEEFMLEHVDRVADAIRRLREGAADILVADLNVLDSKGLETFLEVHREIPEVPVVVLSGMGDETIAISALRQGAQDYMVKGTIDGHRIVGSLRYALERQRLHNEVLRDMSKREKAEELLRKCGTAHLWNSMFHVLGQGAAVVLFDAGQAAGGTSFDFITATYRPKDDAAFVAGLSEHFGLTGLFLVRDLQINRQAKAMHVQVQRSFEAAVPRKEGTANCHFLRGLFAGIAGRLLGGGQLACDETTCEARGADVCTFAVRPLLPIRRGG
jgi:DNA-binding NarL/FixJ family response regulator